MPDPMLQTDRISDTHARSERGVFPTRLWAALFGLAILPALAGVVITGVLLAGTTGHAHAPVPAGAVVGVVALVLLALVATVALLRLLLRPLEGIAQSRSRYEFLSSLAHEDSRRDALTGLGNHRAFRQEVLELSAAHGASGEPYQLVLIDLDHFRVVNDHEGHAAGDRALVSLARTMRELARPRDRLYRIGGDEFAILLPGLDIDDALEATERLLHLTRGPTMPDRAIAFSAGISGVPYFTRDADMLFRQADAALFWAKRHGRGRVEVFDPQRDQLPDDVADATRIAVQEVVGGRLLMPVFQPIVDLRSGRILGFEGLIRPDPKGPLPDTARLFTAAAAVGRTAELDRACIDTVLHAATAIGPDRLLTLNLSPRTLESKDFDADWFLRSLYRAGISPGRVIIELTERDEVADLNRLRETFQHLRQYGLRLAADDVGAGNAGLRLLSQVQFDIVKIDLSLVQDGVRRVGARTVLQSLRDLALSQRAHVVAEGVETREQLRVIRELEIGAGQGFLLGRPDPSVAATFVDVISLGAEAIPAVAATATQVSGSAALPREAWPKEDASTAQPAPRAIILPAPRMATHLELERSLA